MKQRIARTALLGIICARGDRHAAAAAPTAPIHPGVQTLTNGAQCTSNFIFRDATSTYIGQAAHCSGVGRGHLRRTAARAGRCRSGPRSR